MTNEEIASLLISLYARAILKSGVQDCHRDAVANAILKLGYQWDGQMGAGNDL